MGLIRRLVGLALGQHCQCGCVLYRCGVCGGQHCAECQPHLWAEECEPRDYESDTFNRLLYDQLDELGLDLHVRSAHGEIVYDVIRWPEGAATLRDAEVVASDLLIVDLRLMVQQGLAFSLGLSDQAVGPQFCGACGSGLVYRELVADWQCPRCDGEPTGVRARRCQ